MPPHPKGHPHLSASHCVCEQQRSSSSAQTDAPGSREEGGDLVNAAGQAGSGVEGGGIHPLEPHGGASCAQEGWGGEWGGLCWGGETHGTRARPPLPPPLPFVAGKASRWPRTIQGLVEEGGVGWQGHVLPAAALRGGRRCQRCDRGL